MSITATTENKNDHAALDPLAAAWVNAIANDVEALYGGYLDLSVGGSADVTLTDDQAACPIMVFSGILTGSINVIVPDWTKRWLVFNNTSGAYTLTVKTSTGTGIAITQGYLGEVYGDGTNILRRGAESSGGTSRLSTVILAGPVSSPPATAQNLSTGNTITLPTTSRTKRLTATGGAVTGIILTAGTVDGQELVLINAESSNSITFATAATSNVSNGTSCVIAALKALKLVWDATASRWFPFV